MKGRSRYEIANVVYTDKTGAQKEKKVLSFSNPGVFATVSKIASGTVVEVSYAKDDPYFNWAKVDKVDADNPAYGVDKPATPSPAGKVLGSQYETREERQTRQLHIVRQSSLSNAIAMLTPGAKAPLKTDEVLAVAQELVDFVYGNEEILVTPNSNNSEVSEA